MLDSEMFDVPSERFAFLVSDILSFFAAKVKQSFEVKIKEGELDLRMAREYINTSYGAEERYACHYILGKMLGGHDEINLNPFSRTMGRMSGLTMAIKEAIDNPEMTREEHREKLFQEINAERAEAFKREELKDKKSKIEMPDMPIHNN